MDMIPPAWRKSSYGCSSGDNCLETAIQVGTVAVRDTKDPSGPQLAVHTATWRALTLRIKKT
jgi:Domain of unknown function (DUF397)